MFKRFCSLFLMVGFLLLVVELKGFCQEYKKPYSQRTLSEVLSSSEWKKIKIKNATLEEFSKSISQGVKWGMIGHTLLMAVVFGVIISFLSYEENQCGGFNKSSLFIRF